MKLLKQALVRASGNRFCQNLLERNAQISQYLMGIGAGGGVQSSGERAIFEILKQVARPPYCIFDVGANKGQFLQLTLEQIETEDFEIHCFEPGKETFHALLNSANKDNRIKLNHLGLGREPGNALLHYDIAGSGLASLTKRNLEHFNIEFNQTEEVTIQTIDDYCIENSIQHIHLLKIDIEGHELDALAGAKQIFARNSIDMVTFEFGGCNIDTRTYFQDFWYFFMEADFKLFRITPSGYPHPVESYKEIHEQFRTVNYLAVANAR
jgi:FkbM family methyltransferase